MVQRRSYGASLPQQLQQQLQQQPHYPDDDIVVFPTKQLSAGIKLRQLPEEVIDEMRNTLPRSGRGRGRDAPASAADELVNDDDDEAGDSSPTRRRGSRIVGREPEDELGRECVLPLRHVYEEEEEEDGHVPEEIASTKPEDILDMIKL